MPLIRTIWCVFLLLLSTQAFSQISYKKLGMASFYHDNFNGKKTASGEIFNQQKLTCAHRTFPFGTRLKVTNVGNGKSVLVRVNDRGPYAKSRIIDLTRSAAQKLGFTQDGEVIVLIEIVSSEGKSDSIYYLNDSLRPFFKVEALSDTTPVYSIKIGSYLYQHKFLEMVKEVKEKTGLDVWLQTMASNKDILYRIFAGRFQTKREATEKLKSISSIYSEAYVVEMRSK